MANELTVTVGMAYNNGGTALNFTTTADQVTVSANFALRSVYTVPLAGASLPLGGITTPGYILIQNKDATNFILVGNSGDTLPVRVNAGELVLFRFANGIVPYVIADTAAVVIDYMLIES